MLHSISWKEFFEGIGFFLVIYYGWVLLRYFPMELRGIGAGGRRGIETEEEPGGQGEGASGSEMGEDEHSGKGKDLHEGYRGEQGRGHGERETPESASGMSDPPEESPSPFQIAGVLAEEIRKMVGRAAERKMERAELLWSLQQLIRQEGYGVVKEDRYRRKVNGTIRFELDSKCGIKLEEQELNGLWEGQVGSVDKKKRGTVRRRAQGISGAVLLDTEARLAHELRVLLGQELEGVDEWELMAGLVATIGLQKRRLKIRYADAARLVLRQEENGRAALEEPNDYGYGSGLEEDQEEETDGSPLEWIDEGDGMSGRIWYRVKGSGCMEQLGGRGFGSIE